MAAAAVKYIHDGDSIILDMVPCYRWCRCFRVLAASVMTSGLHIVNALSELDNEQTILMPSGAFRKNRRRFHGQLAENALSEFSFDKLFVGN